MSNIVCVCGKKKSNLNSTNWSRHIESCKLIKLKRENTENKNGNIMNFYKRSTLSSDPNMDIKKKRIGNGKNYYFTISIYLGIGTYLKQI